MHRTRGANYATVSGKRRYTDGPPATTVPAVDLNALQEEISNVIEQAGITVLNPENDTFDQLYAAISALITGVDLLGYLNRPKFEYKDGDEIYINPGVYQHAGSVNRNVRIDIQIDFIFGPGGSNADSDALANNDWYYVYLDDSAIVASGHTILTATDFVAVTTEPVWSNTKHGWYNGSDRCIFAVRTDGAASILEFFNTADYVVFADYVSDRALAALSNAWTDVTLTIPKFARNAHCTFYHQYVAGNKTGYWRTKGQAGATGHFLYYGDPNQGYNENTAIVHTDENQKIQVIHEAVAGTDEMAVFTDGWFFPHGM